MDNNIDPYNEGEVEKSLKDITITLKHNNGEQITILNNIDVSNKIRLNKVSDICSIIAPYQKCREFVLNIQRNSAKKFDLIMEGRDISERVMPNADIKFYLYASLNKRAERLTEKMKNLTLDQALKEIEKRDQKDIESGNFLRPTNAIEIDTSMLSIDEIVDLMLEKIQNVK